MLSLLSLSLSLCVWALRLTWLIVMLGCQLTVFIARAGVCIVRRLT